VRQGGAFLDTALQFYENEHEGDETIQSVQSSNCCVVGIARTSPGSPAAADRRAPRSSRRSDRQIF
jgi:hypothetical protein